MDVNKFAVSNSGDSLEVWVEVPSGPAYTDVKIQSIAIQDHNHYTISYPVNPQVELTTTNPVSDFKITNQKTVVKRLNIKSMTTLGLKNTGFFFMYIKTTGQPSDEVTCICFRDITLAVAANLHPLYFKAVKLLDLDSRCGDYEDALIDIAVKKFMFLEALNAQDYTTAIDIWNSILYRDVKEGDCFNADGCNFNNYNNNVVIPFTSGCKTCR